MLATQHIQLLQYKNYTNANTTTTKHSSRFYKKVKKLYMHNDKYAQVVWLLLKRAKGRVSRGYKLGCGEKSV